MLSGIVPEPRRNQEVAPVLFRQRYRAAKFVRVSIAQLKGRELKAIELAGIEILTKWQVVSAFFHEHRTDFIALLRRKKQADPFFRVGA